MEELEEAGVEIASRLKLRFKESTVVYFIYLPLTWQNTKIEEKESFLFNQKLNKSSFPNEGGFQWFQEEWRKGSWKIYFFN